jgi:hypothetical protein
LEILATVRNPSAIVIVARSETDGERDPGAIHQQRQLRPDGAVLARVARLLRELLARDPGPVEADERAVQALALHEQIEECAPDPVIPGSSMPEPESAPMRHSGGGTGTIEVTPAAAGTQHPEDAG